MDTIFVSFPSVMCSAFLSHFHVHLTSEFVLPRMASSSAITGAHVCVAVSAVVRRSHVSSASFLSSHARVALCPWEGMPSIFSIVSLASSHHIPRPSSSPTGASTAQHVRHAWFVHAWISCTARFVPDGGGSKDHVQRCDARRSRLLRLRRRRRGRRAHVCLDGFCVRSWPIHHTRSMDRKDSRSMTVPKLANPRRRERSGWVVKRVVKGTGGRTTWSKRRTWKAHPCVRRRRPRANGSGWIPIERSDSNEDAATKTSSVRIG